MKTNIFKSSFLALAMMASFSACTQNEEFGTPAPADEDILNVVAYSNNFVSTDAASRITDNGTTTTFTDGDAIGVFIVREGEALVSNMKMTLSGTAWKGDNDAPLYYYKNADYIAYYPYTANLAVTTVDEIVQYFTSKISATGQTSLADYRNADLMTAEVKAADVVRGKNITFSFAHKMAMLEVKAPVRSYTTTDGSFTYKAPLGLKVVNDNQELSLCNVGTDETSGKDIFRCILVPSATEMTIQGQFQDGNVEVYFPAVGQEVKYTPAAGTYQGVNIDYDYANYDPSRDLKVGDYYYSDGSIYPGDLTGAPKDGCVGIIFSTTTSTTDQGLGWSHGYVIALNNTSESKVVWKNENTADNAITSFNIDLTDNNTKKDSFQALIDHLDGYTISKSITDNSNAETHPAFFAAKNYSVAIPSTTSGWYLPSMGQLAAVINNLAIQDGETKFTAEICTEKGTAGKFDKTNDAQVAVKRLNDVFTKIGGSLRSEMDITTTGWNLRWWGCEQTTYYVEGSNEVAHGASDAAWCVDMNYGTESDGSNYAKYLFLSRNKNDNTNYDRVRPVFAF